jgi:osmotically inducible lipoprotein OsmB
MQKKYLAGCAMALVFLFVGCANTSDRERSMLTGGAVGAAAAGAVSGEWGWAAAGAAAGALGGYLYDQHKKDEDRAYNQGVQDGRQSR